MDFWIGFLVGAATMNWALSSLIEWALFRRILDDPRTGMVAASSVATVILFFLYLPSIARGRGPASGAFVIILTGILVAVARLLSYRTRKAAEDVSEPPGIEDVFR
ncbi:hypothetical protein [Sphingosinicella sp. BN140058]|uniref:hypothetical protein n=1 Tax=Sphingosinicella sp. BN140058 TaxID=1892855 RepID=UPI001011D892|nr:hypothetical protein [Sphingosinicella sp. BN140058]QAY76542.1 hypothetical protein ETR14_08560 [Sphingosinicella sp. BN140058]